jgi:hypothetical protein
MEFGRIETIDKEIMIISLSNQISSLFIHSSTAGGDIPPFIPRMKKIILMNSLCMNFMIKLPKVGA